MCWEREYPDRPSLTRILKEVVSETAPQTVLDQQATERNHRIEQLSHWIEQLSHRIEQLSHWIEQLSHRIEQLSHRIEQLSHRIEELSHVRSHIGCESVTSRNSELIELDSAFPSTHAYNLFDPLRFCSIDSLLHGNTSPKMQSTFKVSTFPRQQASPQQLLVVESSPSIVSPRYRGLSVPATDRPLPISAPSSQPHPPNSLFRSNSSPAGSACTQLESVVIYGSDGNQPSYMNGKIFIKKLYH